MSASQTVEMQGFEPWSRQGNQRAFYVRIQTWIFMKFQASVRPLKSPYLQLGFAPESQFFEGYFLLTTLRTPRCRNLPRRNDGNYLILN